VKHSTSCAIFRRGDLQAWCDCGAEKPIVERLEYFNQGRMYERKMILERLRYGVKEFRSLGEDYDKWNLVAEILEEEADIIETGDY
jgi:hypothetical protein